MNSLCKWSASFLNFFSQFHKNSCREAEISVGKKVELTGMRGGRQEKILSGQQLRTWGKTRKSHIREQNATVMRQFFPLVTFITCYFTVLHVYSKKLQILKMKKGAKISLLPSTAITKPCITRNLMVTFLQHTSSDFSSFEHKEVMLNGCFHNCGLQPISRWSCQLSIKNNNWS